MNRSKRRIAIYARTSTPTNSARNIADQTERVRASINNESNEIVGEYSDFTNGVSLNSPGLLSLINDVEQLRINTVAVASRDRLSRDFSARIFRELSSRGVEILDISTPSPLVSS